MKLYLLKQATAIACSMNWRGEFMVQCINRRFARAVAFKGGKVGVHRLLGRDDGARTIGARKINEEANCFVHLVHTTRSAARCRTVPARNPRCLSARLEHRLKDVLVPRYQGWSLGQIPPETGIKPVVGVQ